jgi:ribosomal protein S18 acetylase RimI-like enzyme
MDELRIRAATAADVPAIANIVDQAYRHYIARIGKPPEPMLDDYVARVSEGTVWVLEDGAVIAAIIVLLPTSNYLLLDNIAVAPAHQGLGLGRQLLAFAEAEALRRGYREIRLYTHQTMVENQRLYSSIGYEETGRGTEAGYDRVFMRSGFAIDEFVKRTKPVVHPILDAAALGDVVLEAGPAIGWVQLSGADHRT